MRAPHEVRRASFLQRHREQLACHRYGAGFGIFRRSGIEGLFRDARLGRMHPANWMLTHEIVGKSLLGISPDESPHRG